MSGSAADVADTTGPKLLSWPATRDYPVNADLVFTFDEAVKLGAGTITLETVAGVIYSGSLTDNPHLTVNGNSIIFNPPDTLAYATDYWIEFSGSAITDLAGNKYNYQPLLVYFVSAASMVAVETTGTPGHDLIRGSDVADLLSGGEGSDRIHGHRGDDTLRGDGWADELYGDEGNDKLYGGDHNDVLFGGAGDDLLDGGNGNDRLEDAGGNDSLFGGEGDDTLKAGAASTGALDGGAGNDTLSGSSGVDLAGGDGHDAISLVLTGAGTTLSAISGGDGDDEIRLTMREDGDARVTMSGGAGTDTYLLGAPAGTSQIRIDDFAAGAGGDRINLYQLAVWDKDGNPFSNGSLRLQGEGANTLLQQRIDGQYRTLLELAGIVPGQLVRANFVGEVDPDGSNTGITLRGTGGNDDLSGLALNDQLFGEDGNDLLHGLMGNDVLDGGMGNDYLYGDTGSDHLIGGDGHDTLRELEQSGDNRLEGGAGDDWLESLSFGTNMLDGGTGSDWIEAGDGDDTLLGGEGNDDLLLDNFFNTAAHTVVLDGGAGNDLLIVGAVTDGLTAIMRGGAGSDIFSIWSPAARLSIADFSVADGDVLDLQSLFWRQEGGNPFGAAGYLKAVQAGADTQIWVDEDGAAGQGFAFQLAVTLAGLSLDTLSGASIERGWHPNGSNTGFTITGTAGDDVLAGQDLDDTIRGGDGDDTLRGGEGNDLIEGGNARLFGDTLRGEAGDDTLQGGGGNDDLYGGIGNDLLEGGMGNDELYGDEGNDILKGGAGNDTLVDLYGDNTIDGGEGDDRIMVLPFDYSQTEVLGHVVLLGGGGNDTIGATMAVDEIDGGSGNDNITISGRKAEASGPDLQVRGGDGDDTVSIYQPFTNLRGIEARGGAGRDTYMFNSLAPTSLLTIMDFETGAGGDQLAILTGSAATHPANPFAIGEVRLVQRGEDTVLQRDLDGATGTGGWQDAVILKNRRMESFTGENFSEGADPLGTTTGLNLAGSAQHDHLSGGRFDDVLRGAGGNDVLEGGYGADQLYGDAGNDSLTGGEGDDTLYGGEGDDQLSEYAGRNRLEGGDGNDSLSGQSAEGGVLNGGTGNDTLYGAGSNVELDGGSGDDILTVGQTWAGQPAPRSATIRGGDGNDLVQLGASTGAAISVVAEGGAGRDTYLLSRNALATTLTVSDFQAGKGGDLLDLKNFFPPGLSGAPNPFLSGDIQIVQRGADSIVQGRVVKDFIPGYQDLVILSNVAKADLGPDNIMLGFNPDGSQRGRDMVGTAAADQLDGGWLDDRMSGVFGNDRLWGWVGNDLLYGDDGDDILDGDAGPDWPAGLFSIETGDDFLSGGAGNDELNSTWGSDSLYGGDGNDLLRLGYSVSSIYPRTGRVYLQGDAGNDLFDIYYDHDADIDVVMEGGSGRDTFSLHWPSADSTLTILDFQAGAGGDQISVKKLADGLQWIADPFASGHLRFLQNGADTLLQGDSDAGAPYAGFKTLVTFKGLTAASLTADNFVEGIKPPVATPLPPPPPSPPPVVITPPVVVTPPPPPPVVTAPPVTAVGSTGSDELRGGTGNDVLDGGAGNDILFGGAGNDTLVGGDGRDSAHYAGTFANYSVKGGKDEFRISDQRTANGEGTDTLVGVERLVFGDGVGMALDIDGVAGQAFRIYRAAFDRAPDLGGMGFWLASMDKGATVYDLAAGFVASKEFADLYGAAPTNAELVTRLYTNILHRAPEAAGYAYWLDILDSKKADLVGVLAMISESGENVDGVAELIANGIPFTPYG